MDMNSTLVSSRSVANFSLWDKMLEKRSILKVQLEITARCNNDCRHCYLCLPSADKMALENEPTLGEIMHVADEAVKKGALWCTITGGEPLLRKDFRDIYLGLKRKGLLVSVFTNACLLREEHIKLFRKYPPLDIEVTVYGITKETYERVTRCPGSYNAFRRGLDLLLENGIPVRLKAMALRSNVHELPKIAEFCRARTKDYFRFDPSLHLRLDRDPVRNEIIKSERLSPEEIVALERADFERFNALEKGCDKLIRPNMCNKQCNHLFHCGTGAGSFVLGHDGRFRLCLSLHQPDCVYDLRRGSLADAWENFLPRVRDMRSDRKEFMERCRRCSIVNLCIWCPAHAYLETGEMDSHVDYFCQVAYARARSIMNENRMEANSLDPLPAGVFLPQQKR